MRHPLLRGVAAIATLGTLAACADGLAPDALTAPEAPSESTLATSTTTPTVANLVAASGRRYVAVAGGLKVGALQYIDRSFSLTSVPSALASATLVRTANDDKNYAPGSTSVLTFDVSQPAVVYVAMDPKLPRPKWMGAEWTDSGLDLATNDNAKKFNVFRREVAAGRVTLGSNVDAPRVSSMYIVGVAGTTVTSAPVQPAPTAPSVRVGRYVSPSGTSTNDGTVSRPWDLRTALAGPKTLVAGDTLWLRGGTYRGCYTSALTGTATAPIVVRQYPGERVVLDNGGCNDPALTVNGAHTVFWGFEVMNSAPRKDGPIGINVFGDYVKLVNLVVHDAAGSGIGWWAPAAGGEVYGSILYNNGRAFNLDHGIYTQNAEGTKRIADNVILNSWAFGLHVYGSDNASLKGYDIVGNAIFNSGAIGENGAAPNVLVGGGTPASRITVDDNMLYLPVVSSGNLWLGYEVTNADIAVRRNYVAGGEAVVRLWRWTNATVSDNTFYGGHEMVNVQGSPSGVRLSNNTHFRDGSARAWVTGSSYQTFSSWLGTGIASADRIGGTAPTGTKVFVRPNAYEAGRGHVVVYNWSRAASVAVDLSRVLAPGQAFEVRTVQNLAAAPVLTGTYAGGTVAIPMTSTSVAQPIGGSARAAKATGPEFQTFLVTRR